MLVDCFSNGKTLKCIWLKFIEHYRQ